MSQQKTNFFFLSWNYTKRREEKKRIALNKRERERANPFFAAAAAAADRIQERERIKRELPSSGEKKE